MRRLIHWAYCILITIGTLAMAMKYLDGWNIIVIGDDWSSSMVEMLSWSSWTILLVHLLDHIATRKGIA